MQTSKIDDIYNKGMLILQYFNRYTRIMRPQNVIPIQTDEDYLYLAVSYCMYTTEDRHSELRLNTVNKNIRK